MTNSTKYNTLKIQDHPLLLEYINVFIKEIPRLCHKGDIYFSIKLAPGAVLFSKVSYKMRMLELVELKIYLKKMLDNEYIKHNVFPW